MMNYVCECVVAVSEVPTEAGGDCQYSVDLGLQEIVSCLGWVMDTRLRASVRAVCALDC